MGWWIWLGSMLWVVPLFWWCCCRTACPCTPATEWTVVLSGTANGFCSNCSNFDGTYIVARSPELTIDCVGSGMEQCTWGYQNITMSNPCIAGAGCDGMCLMVGQGYIADHRYFSVAFYSGSKFGAICTPVGSTGWRGGFKKDWGSRVPTCSDYSSLAIPFSINNGTACDLSAATCAVTAS